MTDKKYSLDFQRQVEEWDTQLKAIQADVMRYLEENGNREGALVNREKSNAYLWESRLGYARHLLTGLFCLKHNFQLCSYDTDGEKGTVLEECYWYVKYRNLILLNTRMSSLSVMNSRSLRKG